jgi:hypothetical protein
VTPVDLLIFVEDPGAANYVAPLPAALHPLGWITRLVADGPAVSYLRERGIACQPVDGRMTAEEILASANPRLLLVGTSENRDSVGLRLIAGARATGLPSVGVVDCVANARERFRGRGDTALAYAPDWLLVPDRRTGSAYVALGFSPDRVTVCGHPHYDQVQAAAAELARRDRGVLRRRLFPGVEDGRTVAVFAAETSNGMDPGEYRWSSDYTLRGRGESTGRTEIVLEEFLDAVQRLPARPYLVLRLHPKNHRDDFSAYLPEFDRVSAGESPLELLYAADLVVGLTSMLMLEAILLRRPALAILPRLSEREWLPSPCAGRVVCAVTRGEVDSALAVLLAGGLPSCAGDAPVPHDSLPRAVNVLQHLLAEGRLPADGVLASAGRVREQ